MPFSLSLNLSAPFLDSTENDILIGDEYQVSLLPSPNSSEQNDDTDFGGTALWVPSRAPPMDQIEKYLSFVLELFGGEKRFFSEEKALYFLHQCDYSIDTAIQSLKPWEAPVDMGSDDEEQWCYDDLCFICHEGGDLLLCDQKGCMKAFHPGCLKLEKVPHGTWLCPYHTCSCCNQPTHIESNRSTDSSTPVSFFCSTCPNSYCNSACMPSDLLTKAAALGVQEFLCDSCLDKEHQESQKQGWDLIQSGSRHFFKRMFLMLKKEGKILVRVPRINKKELDLYRFYTEMSKRGGIHKVNAMSRWPEIKSFFALPPAYPNAGFLLKRNYMNILLPYERHFFTGFSSMTTFAAVQRYLHSLAQNSSSSSLTTSTSFPTLPSIELETSDAEMKTESNNNTNNNEEDEDQDFRPSDDEQDEEEQDEAADSDANSQHQFFPRSSRGRRQKVKSSNKGKDDDPDSCIRQLTTGRSKTSTISSASEIKAKEKKKQMNANTSSDKKKGRKRKVNEEEAKNRLAETKAQKQLEAQKRAKRAERAANRDKQKKAAKTTTNQRISETDRKTTESTNLDFTEQQHQQQEQQQEQHQYYEEPQHPDQLIIEDTEDEEEIIQDSYEPSSDLASAEPELKKQKTRHSTSIDTTTTSSSSFS